MSEIIEKRKKQLVKHFLKPDKILKKFIPVLGQASFFLGLFSVGAGKDVDVAGKIIDQVLDPILGKIPGIGGILTSDESSQEQDSYLDSDGNIVQGSGPGSSESGGIVGKVVMAVFVIGMLGAFLAIVPGVVGGAGGGTVGEYLGYAGGEVGDGFVAGQTLDGPMFFVSEQAQKVRCAMEGPHCLREWQLENTQRPGSDEVGQRYGLEIRNFDLAAGDSVDIAYKSPDYALPVSFDIHNPRYGFKGVEAENVSYRVSVRDLDQEYCSTDWVPVDAYSIREDAGGEFSGNDIHPGTSAATGFLELVDGYKTIGEDEELTLENCRMLQPGAGDTRTAMLEVKYDYFSQATLGFEAMSRQVRNAEQIDLRNQDSVTADTPVKAALGVRSPALFDEMTGEGQPVPIRATLETDENNVEYQVEEMEITKPSRTCIAGDDGCATSDSEVRQCSFEPLDGYGEGNSLGLTDETKSRLIAGADIGEDTQIPSDYWFSRNTQPDIFGCQLSLEPGHGISASGESLTMHVASNYTVTVEDRIGSFRAFNQLCTDLNCPIVVPLDSENFAEAMNEIDSDMDEYWIRERATCDGVDSADGCSVSESRNVAPGEIVGEIDRGEVAVDLSSLRTESEYFTDYVNEDTSRADVGIVGIEEDRLLRVTATDRYAINATENTVEVVQTQLWENTEEEGGEGYCDGAKVWYPYWEACVALSVAESLGIV